MLVEIKTAPGFKPYKTAVLGAFLTRPCTCTS